MTWTDERVAELIRLWEAGQSASVIGKMLGVSKNSVVGKAHRMKLRSRPSPIKRDAIRKATAKPAPILSPRPVQIAPRPAAPRPAPRRTGKGPHCLWPFGDPGTPEFHFCEDDAVPGKPYCEAHCAKAYINKSRSEDRAA
jgi:GcrA cell cycle regulator